MGIGGMRAGAIIALLLCSISFVFADNGTVVLVSPADEGSVPGYSHVDFVADLTQDEGDGFDWSCVLMVEQVEFGVVNVTASATVSVSVVFDDQYEDSYNFWSFNCTNTYSNVSVQSDVRTVHVERRVSEMSPADFSQGVGLTSSSNESYAYAWDREFVTSWQGGIGEGSPEWVMLHLINDSAFAVARVDVIFADTSYNSDAFEVYGSNDSSPDGSSGEWTLLGSQTEDVANASVSWEVLAEYKWYLINMTSVSSPAYPAILELFVFEDYVPVNVAGFDGATTDFLSVDSSAVDQPVLESVGNMKIEWVGSALDFYGADLASYVTYGVDWVNVESALLPSGVNSSANITLYGSYEGVDVYADGVLCEGCVVVSNDGSSVVFLVPHFTNYSIANGTANGSLSLTGPGNGSVVNYSDTVDFTADLVQESGVNTSWMCSFFINGSLLSSQGSDAHGVAFDSGFSDSGKGGLRIGLSEDISLTSVTVASSVDASVCYVEQVGGSVIATSTGMSNYVASFAPVSLSAANDYYVYCDNGGSSYFMDLGVSTQPLAGSVVTWEQGYWAGSEYDTYFIVVTEINYTTGGPVAWVANASLTTSVSMLPYMGSNVSWNYSCTNEYYNETVNSEEFMFEVNVPWIDASGFDGDTTNFSGVDLFAVDYPVLEKEGVMKIEWSGVDLDFTNANLSAYVTYGVDWVSVDSGNLPSGVNTSASLTLYGSFDMPVLFRDGVECDYQSDCVLSSYNGSDVVFVVPHFTNYSIANGTANGVVALNSPANGSSIDASTVWFLADVTQEGGFGTEWICTLSVDGSVFSPMSIYANSTNGMQVTLNGFENSSVLWNYSCDNAYYNESVVSETFSLFVNPLNMSTGLVAYYNASEASGDLLDTFGVYNLTNSSEMESVPGIIGTGRNVSGENEFSGATQLQFGFNESFTVNQWVYVDNYSGTVALGGVDAGNSGSLKAMFWVEDPFNTMGVLYGLVDGSDGACQDVNVNLTYGVWTMQTMSYDAASRRMYQFVDGVQVCNESVPGWAVSSAEATTFFVGSGPNWGGANMSVDEIGVWSRVIGASEASDLYNAGAGWAYPFEEVVNGVVNLKLLDVSTYDIAFLNSTVLACVYLESLGVQPNVSLQCGQNAWNISVAEGNYTAYFNASGYYNVSKDVSVIAGEEVNLTAFSRPFLSVSSVEFSQGLYWVGNYSDFNTTLGVMILNDNGGLDVNRTLVIGDEVRQVWLYEDFEQPYVAIDDFNWFNWWDSYGVSTAWYRRLWELNGTESVSGVYSGVPNYDGWGQQYVRSHATIGNRSTFEGEGAVKFLNSTIEFWFYDDAVIGSGYAQEGVVVGDYYRPDYSMAGSSWQNIYVGWFANFSEYVWCYNTCADDPSSNNATLTGVNRSAGWHKLQFEISPTKEFDGNYSYVRAYLDGELIVDSPYVNQSLQSQSFFGPYFLAYAAPSHAKYDDIIWYSGSKLSPSDFVPGTQSVNMTMSYIGYDMGGTEFFSGTDLGEFNVSALAFDANMQPSGQVGYTPVNVSWSAASGGAGTVNYEVTRSFLGANISQNTTGTSALYNFSSDGFAEFEIVAFDDFVSVSDTGNFTVNFTVTFQSAVCGQTLPNELDLPGQAQVPVNVTVVSPLGFDSYSANVTLSLGATVSTSQNCSVLTLNATTGKFVCFVPLHYWYAAGDYDMNGTFTVENKSANVSIADMCEFVELMASQRTTAVVSFPSAAPGVANASGNTPVVMLNTGNAPFNLYLTGYDLTGRTTPASELLASTFRAGKNLSSSVLLQDGVMKNVSIAVAPAQGAQGNVSLWVSMPAGQPLQEYYSQTPWVLTASS